jgi:hypothetical protein
MPKQKDESYGAVVNTYQLRLLISMFGIHPWTYVHENPFELTKQLEKQEQAMERMGLS